MNSTDPEKSLSRALADWRVAPVRDPRFRAETWARIGSERAGNGPWTNYLREHAALVAGALAVTVVLGGWTGREWARAQAAADRATLVAVYVQALDARVMSGP